MNLEQDLTIDPNHLDSEWINLPSLYFKYREESDHLDIILRKKKMKLDYEIALLDGQVRTDPRSYLGVERPTETQIKCFIESSETIFEIRCSILDAEKKKKLLQSACDGLEMKRDALRNLVQLMNGEYFTTRRSDFSTSASLAEKSDITKRNIRREIRERMNKKHLMEENK